MVLLTDDNFFLHGLDGVVHIHGAFIIHGLDGVSRIRGAFSPQLF